VSPGQKVDSHGCTITQPTVDIWWQPVILQKNIWFIMSSSWVSGSLSTGLTCHGR